MKTINKKFLIIIGVILLMLTAISYDIYYAFQLSQNFDFTNAKIINSINMSGGRQAIVYIYEVNGEQYEKSTSVSYFKCSNENNNTDFCIGNTFKVRYSIGNPNINDILLGKYEKFKSIGLRNGLYKYF